MGKRNRIFLALAIGAVLVLAASSVVRCSLVHRGDQLGQTVPAESSASSSFDDGVRADDDAGSAPSSDGSEAIGILKGHAWSSADGKGSIAFKDGRYIESDGKTSSVTTFDIESISDGPGQTSVMLSLDKPDGTTKDSLVLVRRDASGAYTVSSDDFALAKSYRQGIANAGAVKVVGVNGEFRELLGGTTDGLAKAITDYAHANAPTATSATWDSSLVVDYAAGTVSANFKLDDAASTVLTVEYARGSSSFTVMG